MKWLLSLLLLCYPAFGATKLYLQDTGDTPLSGYRGLLTTNAGGATTGVTLTTASGTNIQCTKTTGGAALAWISPPLSAAVTIEGTITINIPGYESATGNNAKLRARVYKYSGTETENASSPFDMASELTGEWATNNWTGTPTSTAYAIGERIVFRVYLTNVGTMSGDGSRSVTIGYGSAAGNGDGWVTFTETLAFCAEPSCLSMPALLIEGQ